ncbi:SpoIID/LytB domain-containing protein [Nocardioides panacisoli]|uniref:SpoIID/LytB domain-containing protein n=1 Tax=Nocardioides panacisoli TaxID=627624 RepID=UPI001C62FFA4|nr:SpoIID/LytB domain-containing protein [Nocardioides panacisoli]QYJ04363.1 SpoIID/LytB domain-containing protein [Nocardioides panacisoli]
MVRTRLSVLLVAGALVAVTLLHPDARDRGGVTDEVELTGASSVVLKGRGYGHGRGLSQHGARGAAEEHGKGYRQILDFYYPGTSWDTGGGAIKVLLTGDTNDSVKVRARSGLKARSLRTGDKWRLARAGAKKWRLRPVRKGAATRITVWVDGGWQRVRDVPGEVEFVAGGRPITLLMPRGSRSYRGKLQSLRAGGGDRITVNRLNLEKYLRGVVPREVPALWHPQAVRSQAVAARTYAIHERNGRWGETFHVRDTVASQVYGGATDEHPAATDAIRATHREMLTHGGKPAFTQFSASNGGWSAPGPLAYQQARQDPWDRWSGNPHRWWRVRLGDRRIEQAYPKIGDFQRLHVADAWRDGNGQWGGRVEHVRIVGSKGRVTVSGSDFRFRFGLKSTWFTVG